MAYKSLFPNSSTRPPSQKLRFEREQHPLIPILQANIPISLWICLGAILQSTLLLLPLSHFITHWRFYAVLPAFLYLLSRFVLALLISYNFISNPYLKGSIGTRFTALVPDTNGVMPEEGELQPNKNKVAVLILSARFNHPFGAFGGSDSGKFIQLTERMFSELDTLPQSESGLLGQTTANVPTPSGVTEGMNISYWRSVEHIHKYAASPKHVEAISWWHKKEREMSSDGNSKLRHIGIMHEIFEAPAGCWESIYLNFQPTLLSATTYETKNGEWANPIIDARRGRLRSSKGRLGRDPRGDGRQVHEKEGDEIGDY